MHHHDDQRPGVGISRRRLLVSTATIAASGFVASTPTTSAQDAPPSAGSVNSAIPPETIASPRDWPVAQGNLAATRAAAESGISAATVDRLELDWSLTLTAQAPFGAITSNPVVIDETVYIIDNNATIQAVRRKTGEVIWKKLYNVPTLGPNGVAVGYGYLVGVLGDSCTVVALDAATGEERWQYRLSNHPSLGITMAPLIYDRQIFVSTEPGGNTTVDYGGGAAGVVYCLDLETGATQWTWETVTGDLWGNFRVNSGGGLWYPPSVDDEGMLYMGIGNAGPYPGTEEFPNGSSRPGDNDFANNIVALDPKAGKVRWHLNIKPHDLFDHDNQQTPVLATVPIGGVPVDLAVTSGKHGFVVAVARDSGIEYWRTPVGRHQNDLVAELGTEPLEVFPGSYGGVEAPMAYQDGTLYVATLNYGMFWTSTGVDYSNAFDLSTATTQIVALDAATGQIIWDTLIPTSIAGAGPTIANDLLFVGGLDGIIRALSLADGAVVWTMQTSAGLNAPFAIAGDQLFVPAGGPLFPSLDTIGQETESRATFLAFRLSTSA